MAVQWRAQSYKHTQWKNRHTESRSHFGTRCSGFISQIAVQVWLAVPNKCVHSCRVSHTSKNQTEMVWTVNKTDTTYYS